MGNCCSRAMRFNSLNIFAENMANRPGKDLDFCDYLKNIIISQCLNSFAMFIYHQITYSWNILDCLK
jgi:hypothetical protein